MMTRAWLGALIGGALLMGCGSDDPYCCAVAKVAADPRYSAEYRARLSRVADAKNEEVCRTYVEQEWEDFEDVLVECAGE
jgi:hypothetical protein